MSSTFFSGAARFSAAVFAGFSLDAEYASYSSRVMSSTFFSGAAGLATLPLGFSLEAE